MSEDDKKEQIEDPLNRIVMLSPSTNSGQAARSIWLSHRLYGLGIDPSLPQDDKKRHGDF